MNNALPKGWVLTKLKDIAEYVNGRAFKPGEWATEGLPIIRIQNLNNPQADFNYCNFEVDKKYIINEGQLLFAWSGTPGTSFGAHIWKGNRSVLNQHIFKVEINENCINKDFLMYLLNNNITEYVKKAHGTAGLAHITKGKFEESFIAIPPLPEQHRIVGKIEELFTKLNAGVEALKKVKAQVRRYRQAVLKFAMEGKLTEKWRKEHKGKIEPASALLERIKKEMPLKKGKIRNNPPLPPLEKGGEGGFDEIASPSASATGTADRSARNDSLHELPEGWVWTRVGEIGEVIQYGTSEKANNDPSGIPVLRMGNIQDGKLIFENLKYFPRNLPDLKDFFLQDGDVLFNRTNSAELVGKTAVFKNRHPKSVFASYLIRVRVNKNVYHPDMLSFFINSFYGRKYISSVVSQQVGQANVNGTKLSHMPIPLPPLAEQEKIVEEIERRFSATDEVEKIVQQSLTQAERLRQTS